MKDEFSKSAQNGKITQEDIIKALKICPYTSYKIANETSITQASIQNYRTGRSKPSTLSIRILAEYLRLKEYISQKEDIDYLSFLENVGTKPLLSPKNTTIGYKEEYVPSKIQNNNKRCSRVSRYDDTLEACQEQVEALYALIKAQKKTIDIQKMEIQRLNDIIEKAKE